MTSYQTPQRDPPVSTEIAERADGETYIPILPNKLDEWAIVTKGLEASLAVVEGLLGGCKEQVTQLEADNKRYEAWWDVAVLFIGKKTERMAAWIEFINKNDNEELVRVFEAYPE